MRKAIYRGKHNHKYSTKEEWVFGVPYFDSDNDCIIATHNSKCVVDPDTVGEFAGIKDDRGEMLFEGDIIRLERSFFKPINAVVVFDCGTFGIKLPNFDSIISFADYEFDLSNFEIIGNIHDNPELLEVI